MSAFPILTYDQLEAALAGPGLVLLDFWQGSCAPCRALEPRLEHFGQRHPSAFTGYRIDIDADLPTAETYGVQSIPTILLLRNGREIDRLDGLILDLDLEEALTRAQASAQGQTW